MVLQPFCSEETALTTAPHRDTLDERYGRRASSPARRRAVRAAGVAAALAGVGAVGWLGLLNADPPVTSRWLGSTVVDPTRVTVRFLVDVESGVPATCTLLARAADQAVVGRRSVEVPAGAARQLVLEEDVATERAAAGAELVGCTAPGQRRPR